MIKRALMLAAFGLVLAVPGEVRSQSLFAELGLIEEGEQASSATSVRVAQVRRGRTTYSNSLDLGGPRDEAEEEADAPAANSSQRDPRDRQVQGSSLFSLFATDSVPYQFRRQTVRYETNERPGTIVIDTTNKYLYHVGERGTATRYGVGVGRAGFEWKGTAYVGHKREWPDWHPPASMRAREPWLPVRMEGGPENPLGARAMYLYRGGADTLYRIHGTNQPTSIGQALSSGCIRMLNEDVMHLYSNVKTGTRVVVL